MQCCFPPQQVQDALKTYKSDGILFFRTWSSLPAATQWLAEAHAQIDFAEKSAICQSSRQSSRESVSQKAAARTVCALH